MKNGAEKKRASQMRSPFVARYLASLEALAQRPKNSHSKMITGIGTPSIQSKSPRPISQPPL